MMWCLITLVPPPSTPAGALFLRRRHRRRRRARQQAHWRWWRWGWWRSRSQGDGGSNTHPLHTAPHHSTRLHTAPHHSTPLHTAPHHTAPRCSTPLYTTPHHSTPLHTAQWSIRWTSTKKISKYFSNFPWDNFFSNMLISPQNASCRILGTFLVFSH
jgi:hypothetical protein